MASKRISTIAVLIFCSLSMYIACEKPDQPGTNTTPSGTNTAPVVDAGKDITLLYPDNSTFLKGAFVDNDTSSASFLWTFLSGGSYPIDIETPRQLATKVSRLTEGKYLFQLTVTDREGLIGRDTIEITSFYYVVSAGSNQVIALPLRKGKLNGSTILSPDSILKKEWKKISGPNVTIVSPNELTTEIIDLEEGVYNFELAVTDKTNITRKSLCQISVIQPGGPQISFLPIYSLVNLPTSFTSLKANTSPNQYTLSPVTKTAWTKVSGPSGLNIENSLSNDTRISGLQEGVYEIKFEATDALGKVTSDTITVAVVDPLSTNQEIIILAVPYNNEGGGFDCDYMDVELKQYLPAGKPIKKLYAKCGSEWIEANLWGILGNDPYQMSYTLRYGKLKIAYCGNGCNPGGRAALDIKIVY